MNLFKKNSWVGRRGFALLTAVMILLAAMPFDMASYAAVSEHGYETELSASDSGSIQEDQLATPGNAEEKSEEDKPATPGNADKEEPSGVPLTLSEEEPEVTWTADGVEESGSWLDAMSKVADAPKELSIRLLREVENETGYNIRFNGKTNITIDLAGFNLHFPGGRPSMEIDWTVLTITNSSEKWGKIIGETVRNEPLFKVAGEGKIVVEDARVQIRNPNGIALYLKGPYLDEVAELNGGMFYGSGSFNLGAIICDDPDPDKMLGEGKAWKNESGYGFYKATDGKMHSQSTVGVTDAVPEIIYSINGGEEKEGMLKDVFAGDFFAQKDVKLIRDVDMVQGIGKDIPLLTSGKCTFDLNGYKLKYAGDRPGYALFAVRASGKLTIKGEGESALKGSIYVDGRDNAELFIEGGNFTSDDDACVLITRGKASLSGGTFEAKDSESGAIVDLTGNNGKDLKGLLAEGCVFDPETVTDVTEKWTKFSRIAYATDKNVSVIPPKAPDPDPVPDPVPDPDPGVGEEVKVDKEKLLNAVGDAAEKYTNPQVDFSAEPAAPPYTGDVEEAVDKVRETMGEGKELSFIYEICLSIFGTLKTGGESREQINELTNEVEIWLPIPENLQDVDHFELYRVHGSGAGEKAGRLDCRIERGPDGRKYLVFRSDRFSVYAAVQDKNGGGNNPNKPTNRPESDASESSVTGTWRQDAAGWWYDYGNHTWPSSEWSYLAYNGVESWYYFDARGYMVTGWFTDKDGRRYYLHPISDGRQGYMYTGKHQIDGVWYYFNDTVEGKLGEMK